MPEKSPGMVTGRRYRSILVPLDGSRLSEQAIPLAVAIAERARAKLRFVLVYYLRGVPPSHEGRQLYDSLELAARRSEKTYLGSLIDKLKRQSSSSAITSTILTGPVAGTLREYIQEKRIDLVIMTSRGHGGLRRVWLGSVADSMIRKSSVPVLLVPPEENPTDGAVLKNLNRILVPLDGSTLAEAIVDPAKELALLAAAELMLMTVIQPLASALESQSAAPSKFDVELTNLRRREADEYLKGVAEACSKAGVKTTYSATLGTNVANTILDLAESPAVGMIALATHGRGGVKRLALGSVADKVARAAPGPILIYRPPGRRKFKA